MGNLRPSVGCGAVGVVFGLMSIIQACGFTFGHGAGSIISRKLGAKETDDANLVALVEAIALYGNAAQMAAGVEATVLSTFAAELALELEEDVDLAIEAGATAVSTNDIKLWNYR